MEPNSEMPKYKTNNTPMLIGIGVVVCVIIAVLLYVFVFSGDSDQQTEQESDQSTPLPNPDDDISILIENYFVEAQWEYQGANPSSEGKVFYDFQYIDSDQELQKAHIALRVDNTSDASKTSNFDVVELTFPYEWIVDRADHAEQAIVGIGSLYNFDSGTVQSIVDKITVAANAISEEQGEVVETFSHQDRAILTSVVRSGEGDDVSLIGMVRVYIPES